MTAEIPHQALYRRWRAQTFSEIVGQEAVVATLRNAVATGRVSHAILFTGSTRHRQDVARPDPGQGGQLHGPPAERGPLRPLPVVRRDPRGPGARPGRDRRGVQSRHRGRARAARAARLHPDRPAAEGLHPRRGAPDHEGRLERAPQVARGAARVRNLHVRLDAPAGVPARDPVAAAAVRRPAAHRAGDHRQARADPGGRWPRRRPRGRGPRGAARRRRDARRRVDPRPAAGLDRWPGRGRGGPRAPRPRRRRLRGRLRGGARDGRRRGGDRPARRARGPRPGPARVPRPGRRRASASGCSRR